MRRSFPVFLAIIMMVSFSSCMELQFNPEELMEPPALSEEHRLIYEALEDAIGDSFQLQYPNTGEYRSAIVFRDLDANGDEEALVLYQAEAGSSVRINVLDQDQEQNWKSVCDVAGAGTSVDRVVFADLTAGEKEHVIIGFNQISLDSAALNLYEYDTETKMLKLIYPRDYSEMTVMDVDQNGVNELVVFNNNYVSRRAYVRVLQYSNGEFIDLWEADMNEDVTEYVGIYNSKLPDGRSAIYIDSLLSTGRLITEVVLYEDGNFVNKMYGYQENPIDLTARPAELTARDINDDGIIEIPRQIELPGNALITSEQKVHLTCWQQLNGNMLDTVLYTVDNIEYGYQLIYPDRWIGKVTVNHIIENNELEFVLMSDEDGEMDRVLLGIRVHSKDDVIDQFALTKYTESITRGNFKYYIYFPRMVNEPMALTEEELDLYFQFLQ